MKPVNDASASIENPIIQLISRGRRNAPVKKMRPMWTKIAATKHTAAQWWIWRIM